MGEAVERYSISWRGSEPARIARLADVDALPLHSLFQFSPAQYAQRELWNAKNEVRQRIPQPFDASRPVAWCDVKSLVSGQIRQVPAAYCYMNYRNAEQPEIYFGDTNGCAAGSTHQAAVLAAALEIIERDAVAIWWYNRLRRPAVELDSFGHDGILQIRDALRKIERSAYVLDITTGLGVPCFAAVVPKPDGSSPCFGAAAHPSAAIAAFRALSEAVQVWFWSTNLGGNSALQEFLRTTSATGDSFLAPETVSAATPGEPRQTTAQMLDSVVQKLHACGIESFELDCTRRETGVPVVRVIAPGLRHFWARFGPGRLYDVPVEMGWRRTPLPEEALNPVPCMI
jgi:ribosomal protein S12 methylthiotransferase accessory factor